MAEALTEGNGELFVINVDHISQLKACVNLKKKTSTSNASKFSSQAQISFIYVVFVSTTCIGPSLGGRAILS